MIPGQGMAPGTELAKSPSGLAQWTRPLAGGGARTMRPANGTWPGKGRDELDLP